ncbi:MAG: pyridoxal phosphate-dependent aminotransferase family protein [Bacteroidetes bacterium]|nr:MAG: pyridoxal phosphate-dependent aminotransferase family protein [Bacteroidota bacterium]
MPTFSGTSYLGLDRHPGYVRLTQEGLQRYGVHYGGSRRSPLSPGIFAEAEACLAAWTGAPAALLVSSGTSAGQLVVRYLASQQQHLHYSPGVHPALWWPNAQEHQKWTSWASRLTSAGTACLTDAIDPLAVRRPDWKVLPRSGAGTLVIDDSHAMGILGERGAGSWRELRQQWSGELIVVASLGKALALPAGVILGTYDFITALREQPQFGGASPPSPAPIYAFLKAQTLIARQQSALQARIHRLQQAWHTHPDLRFLPHYPVTAVARHQWVDQLQQSGITISSFHYPGPADPRYSRIVLRADHRWEEVEALIKALKH